MLCSWLHWVSARRWKQLSSVSFMLAVSVIFSAVGLGYGEDTDVTNCAQPHQDLLRQHQPPSTEATEATSADMATKVAYTETAVIPNM